MATTVTKISLLNGTNKPLATVTPNGNIFCSGGGDNTYLLNKNGSIIHNFNSSVGTVAGIAADAEYGYVVDGSGSTVKVYNLSNGNVHNTFSTNFSFNYDVRVNKNQPSGNFWAVGDRSDEGVSYYDIDGNLIDSHTYTSGGYTVLYRSSNDEYITYSNDVNSQNFNVYDVNRNKINTVNDGTNDIYRSFDLWDDNKVVAKQGLNGSSGLVLYDLTNESIINSKPNFNDNTAKDPYQLITSFEPYVVYTRNGDIKFWDAINDNIIGSITNRTYEQVTDQFSDGDIIATDSNNDIYVLTTSNLSGAVTLKSIDTTLASNELLIDGSTSASVTANFDDGSSSDVTSDATITSNDTSIATVSNSTVTPQNFGSTTIQAEYNGNTDTAPLDVVQDIVMSTLRVGNVTEDDAVLYGEITQRNDSTISALNVGFDYKKTANNTYQSINAESVNLDEISFPYEYSVFLDNLDSGSNYEFRAFGEEP